jgi:MHS family proline/betaine transporter-like MFS transporter
MGTSLSHIPSFKRNAIGGVVGNALEWYDFALFGYFAPVIGTLFFPSDDATASTIKAFGVFAAGYLMRPLGGIIFGHLGDRLGRKRALEVSVIMMALPTTAIGLVPTHAAIGIAAPVILILLRLVQGVSVGGEFVGSVSFVTEIAPPERRGFLGSLALTSSNTGIMLGSAVATVAHGLLGEATLDAWAWRIPFLLGMVIGLFGLWLRTGLTETPPFEQIRQAGKIHRNPVMDVVRTMPGSVVRLAVVLFFFAGGFYALFVWWPIYLTKMLKPSVPHALLVNTIAICVLIALEPVAGWLSDIIGHQKVLAAGLLTMALVAYPLTVWTDMAQFSAALIAQVLFAIIVCAANAPIGAVMAEMFPTQNRYSGIAISYNVTLGVVGGTAPLVCTWLTSTTGDMSAPAYYLIAMAGLSLTAVLGVRLSHREQLG